MRTGNLSIMLAAGTALVVGSLIVAFAYSGNGELIGFFFGTSDTPSISSIGTAEAAVLPMDVKETFPLIERYGDAKDNPKVKIDAEFIDPDEHCEFCYRVEIEPGATGKLGVALKANKVFNLEKGERLYLFARGGTGGEGMQFNAAGKYVDERANGKVTKLMKYAYSSENMKLKKDWQRYEMDLSNVDLRDVSYGFGFDVATSNLNSSDEPIVIYLKGITIDDLPAEKPIPAAASAR
jgi:hypothetical protein